MGIKANTLRYRSKRDGEIIVGSEIRAALDELENENSELRAQLAANQKVLRCAEEETKMHKVGVDASGEISEVECDCKLCNAVRAAKEARDE